MAPFFLQYKMVFLAKLFCTNLLIASHCVLRVGFSTVKNGLLVTPASFGKTADTIGVCWVCAKSAINLVSILFVTALMINAGFCKLESVSRVVSELFFCLVSMIRISNTALVFFKESIAIKTPL